VQDKLPSKLQSIKAEVNQEDQVRFCMEDECTDYMAEDIFLASLYALNVDVGDKGPLESFQKRMLVYLLTTFDKQTSISV
jgi:hypothetical protein